MGFTWHTEVCFPNIYNIHLSMYMIARGLKKANSCIKSACIYNRCSSSFLGIDQKVCYRNSISIYTHSRHTLNTQEEATQHTKRKKDETNEHTPKSVWKLVLIVQNTGWAQSSVQNIQYNFVMKFFNFSTSFFSIENSPPCEPIIFRCWYWLTIFFYNFSFILQLLVICVCGAK